MRQNFNGEVFKCKGRNPGSSSSNCGSCSGVVFFRWCFFRSFLFWDFDIGAPFRLFFPADDFPFVALVEIDFPGEVGSQELPINPPMDPFAALKARSRSFTAVMLANVIVPRNPTQSPTRRCQCPVSEPVRG